MIAREGDSLKRSPLPRAPSLRDGGRGTLGGEAASLREAPLPPDPSHPKSGWRSAGVLLHGWFRLSVSVSPVSLVVVTAADRAAATFAGWGDAGGRGRFSERSASPPRPLSPEERLAFSGVASAWVVPPERGRVSGKLGCGHGRRNPSARFAGTSPFRGGF